MCGFVSILGASRPGELARMAQAVARRGPDSCGAYDDGAFAAIHHRLAIVGPDPRGSQPMTIGGITVCFNGCIYNYPELRRHLERQGVALHSDTDTEILPHLYRRHGFGMFAMLDGMFAIVLWDAQSRLLIAARDPFGEKPLFICEQAGRIGLASTLTAFECGDWQLAPNLPALADLLGRMRIEAPATLYREVRQLPAGFYAMAHAGEALQLRRYHFLPEPKAPLDLAPSEILPEIERLLGESFRRRLLADRPLGLFLSGGIDSALIAALLAPQLAAPLHTYSVRFADAPADFDESGEAAEVAAALGCRHTTLPLRADALDTLEAIAEAFDQPVLNSSALPTFLICRAAKAEVDVALSGVGGDELFGGYPRYLGVHWHGRLLHLPGRRLLATLLPDHADSRNRSGRLRRFLHGLDQPTAIAYGNWIATAGVTDALFALPLPPPDAFGWPNALNVEGGLAGLMRRYGTVDGAMLYDQLTYLPDDLLAMGDRMSMAHALELRAPFLDVRLQQLMAILPSTMKVAGAPWREGLKLPLRTLARRHLPAAVAARPKRGFMAPVKLWLRGPLQPEVERLLAGKPLGGLLRRERLSEQWQLHLTGMDRSDLFWGVLLLDRWMTRRGWRFDG